MGRFAWSFQSRGKVAASPEAVRAWWLSPDRMDEFKSAVEQLGGLEVSMEDSVNDGVRVRTSRWKDDRGWEHIHRVPLHPAQDSFTDVEGDSSVTVVPFTDSTELSHPTGERMTVTCSGRLEFHFLEAGATEVREIHDHELSGGRRRRRRTFPQSQQQNTEALFEQMIERCRSALEIPDGPPVVDSRR